MDIGFPEMREYGGMSTPSTMEPAAITEWCPMLAPPLITECDPINTFDPIYMSLRDISISIHKIFLCILHIIKNAIGL